MKMKLSIILALSCIANGSQHDSTSVKDTLIRHDKCEKITEPLCMDIPYNRTIMPNIFGHNTQEEAGIEIHQYFSFIKIQCSSDLRLFLCSVYFPACTVFAKPKPPCRSLCLSAKNGCERNMEMLGFHWADKFNCDLYPENSDCCVQQHNFTEIRTTKSSIISKTLNKDDSSTSVEDTLIRHDKCEKMTEPLCMDIPYNRTIMPNIFGHNTQEQAGIEIHQFFSFIKIQCISDLRLFLCSVYFPACTVFVKPKPPCRSLCLSAKSGCERNMEMLGFHWADKFNCELYPENSNCCVEQHHFTEIPTTEPSNTSKMLYKDSSLLILIMLVLCGKLGRRNVV